MRVGWIGGWGVAPESLRPVAERLWPGAQHVFFAPAEGVAERAAGFERVVAWSLGAWHILEAASRGQVPRGEALLLAPFLAFCGEYGLGGRCRRTQVRWLRRWIQRDAIGALRDFYERAGLGAGPKDVPYGEAGLVAGLDRLAEDASPALRRFAATGLPEGWRAVVGADDSLLDASVICRVLPGCESVPGAGHSARELLAVLEREPHAL